MTKTGYSLMRRIVETTKSGTVPTLRQVAATVDCCGINFKLNRDQRMEMLSRLCHALCLIIDRTH